MPDVSRSEFAPRFETLEPRHLLSASPLVPVGQQPDGGLSGKIVYVHAGHGITANNTGSGSWGYQRPNLLGMVEDLGNQDQMTFFADYLFNAGATVVPLRPIGHQPFEVVLDNDDPGVTFSGAWNNSSASIYFGDASDVAYRFTNTSSTETAVATYRPDLPSEGYYPIYAWTSSGSNRATDQLYRVNHAGGSTEVTVDHTKVGNGLVYLGTYYFDRGTSGSVEISNRSDDAGRVVIADMIRFGNGVGDIDRGGGVSGQLREDEAGLYWVQWHVDRSQGIPTSEYRTSSSDSSATVSLAPRWAEWMNREASGSLSDRVFISYHSNAGGGSARGVISLYNGNNRASAATPNQLLLAQLTAREINDDLVDQNGQFEHNWADRGNNLTLDRTDFEFGEINNERINGEFDATIIETGFHDNQLDAEMLRDPKVRDALARATYQGVVNYFRAVDGNQTPATTLPGEPTDVVAVPGSVDGSVLLAWRSPEVNSYNGDDATGYRVYTSTDGRGWDGGTYVDGGSTAVATISGLDPTQGVYFFKVAAVNAGGESLARDVVAATPYTADQQVLIVDGFDRSDRTLNPRQAFPGGGTTERVRPQFSNSQDYVVQHASAIEAWAPRGIAVSTATNERFRDTSSDFSQFDAVIWMLGEESSADDTFDAAEQAKVQTYLGAGGKLFVSGAEIGWDLDNLNNGRLFYNQTLRADYAADDANTYDASGVSGSIFEGVSLEFDDGTFVYDVNFADVINPANGSTLALTYGTSGTGGGAAVQFNEQLVMLGFPFETILDERDRFDVMGAALNYFGLDGGLTHLDRITASGSAGYTDDGGWTTSLGGFNGGTQRVLTNPSAGNQAQWETLIPIAGTYELLIHHGATSNAATSVPYAVQTASGDVLVNLNQSVDATAWRSAGVYELEAGTNTVTLLAELASGGTRVSADAIRWVAKFDGLTPGDADLDGDVDFTDAMAVVAGSRMAADGQRLWSEGDFDFDGDVDAQDIAVFRANYQGFASAPSNPVPAEAVLTAVAADAARLSEGERITPPGNGSNVAFVIAATESITEPLASPVLATPTKILAEAESREESRREASLRESPSRGAVLTPHASQVSGNATNAYTPVGSRLSQLTTSRVSDVTPTVSRLSPALEMPLSREFSEREGGRGR